MNPCRCINTHRGDAERGSGEGDVARRHVCVNNLITSNKPALLPTSPSKGADVALMLPEKLITQLRGRSAALKTYPVSPRVKFVLGSCVDVYMCVCISVHVSLCVRVEPIYSSWCENMPALCTHSNLLLSVVCKHVNERTTENGRRGVGECVAKSKLKCSQGIYLIRHCLKLITYS